jgi:hypothetical protein
MSIEPENVIQMNGWLTVSDTLMRGANFPKDYIDAEKEHTKLKLLKSCIEYVSERQVGNDYFFSIQIVKPDEDIEILKHKLKRMEELMVHQAKTVRDAHILAQEYKEEAAKYKDKLTEILGSEVI